MTYRYLKSLRKNFKIQKQWRSVFQIGVCILLSFKIVIWKLFLRKQPTSFDATTVFPAKWRLINECRNFILTTCHCLDMGSASDWLIGTGWPVRSTTQIWVVTRHQYGILRRHFAGEISGGVSRNFGCFLALKKHQAVTSVMLTQRSLKERFKCVSIPARLLRSGRRLRKWARRLRTDEPVIIAFKTTASKGDICPS